MAKFRKNKKGGMQPINTSALPDIIFMLLFFFMVSTTMKEVSYKVEISNPEATEIEKLEKKSLVSFIYVGPPIRQYKARYGSEPRIQLNDQFATANEIESYIAQERESMKESDRPKMMVSLKVDKKTKMGVVTDITQALRRAQALKINYSARKRAEAVN